MLTLILPTLILAHHTTQLEGYKRAYEDSENTHRLREQSEAALKAEVAQLQVGPDWLLAVVLVMTLEWG